MSTSHKSIGHLLKIAQHRLRVQMDEALKPLGLTTPQYAVLSSLEAEPGVSNAALARSAFVTAQTMHGIIVNLEKLKLIERMDSKTHGRVKQTALTEKGAHLLVQAHGCVAEAEKMMLGTFSPADEKQLKTTLLACIENLSLA